MLTKKDFIDQLATLVEFKTITGDVQTNAKALDYIQGLINQKAQVKRIKNNQTEILIASNTDSKNPDFGYLVHLDVVAGADDLFKLRQKDNLVFGRGVSDMKFSIPVGIALINESVQKNGDSTISLIITTDEEVGGFDGGKFLSDQLEYRPKVLIVPDGGDNMNFVNKSKGIAQFRVTNTGTTAHASRPWLGKNAIPALAQLIVELEKEYGANSKKENWNTTLNFGKIRGGESTNQVCDQAVVELDFRYPETDSIEKIEANLQQKAGRLSKNIQIEKLSTGLPTFTDESLPIVQQFLKILSKSMKVDIQVKPAYGGSDARHFTPFKIPILMIKPNGGGIHSVDEWLDVDSTLGFYEGLREFLFGNLRIK